jgi:hypothetical protein
LCPVGPAYCGIVIVIVIVIVIATKKEAQNALTSLAGQTDSPHDGWRCAVY